MIFPCCHAERAARGAVCLAFVWILFQCLPLYGQAPLTGLQPANQWRSPPPPPGSSQPAWTTPWFAHFSASFGIEANDNINVSQTGQEGDLILRPSVQLQTGYAFARDNQLTLNLEVGYAKYVAYPQNDSLFLNSEGVTGLNLNLHVGRTLINLHDRISLEQDPVSEGEVIGQSDYQRLLNITGISVQPESDLFKIVVGYDHIVYFYNAAFADENHAIDSLYGQFGVNVGESALYSVVLGWASIGATPGADDSGSSYSASLRASLKATDFITVNAEAGYGNAQFVGSLVPGDNDQTSTFFGSLSLQHRINKWVTQTLRAGTDIVPSVLSNYQKEIYATDTATWAIFERLSLSSQLAYVNSISSLTTGDDHYTQYIAGADLSCKLARKLSATLSYRFTVENSNVPNGDYRQNQLILQLTQAF